MVRAEIIRDLAMTDAASTVWAHWHAENSGPLTAFMTMEAVAAAGAKHAEALGLCGSDRLSTEFVDCYVGEFIDTYVSLMTVRIDDLAEQTYKLNAEFRDELDRRRQSEPTAPPPPPRPVSFE